MTSSWDAAAFRDRVAATLTEALDEFAGRLAPLGPDVALLVDEARALLAGGKRLRAAFCWWGYVSVGGSIGGSVHGGVDPADEPGLLRACAALEVLHASALVHDDYMDASATRRGRPATHVAFADRHREAAWRGSPETYGASAAILLGDLLLTWADELLRRCGLPADRGAAALDLFDLTRSEVVAGQFLDVSAQAQGGDHPDPLGAAMRVVRFKSAKYSVERPLHVGAALAGATPDQLEALSAYGLPTGEAFQLRDDLLGVLGDPAVTGKPAGDDLVEGKRTVLVAYAIAQARPEDAAALDAGLGTALSPEQVERLRRVVLDSGAADRVEAMIGDLTRQARAALGSPRIGDAARGVLEELLVATTQRTS
ncbi:polyprenyl synthetase family protein [Nocardioidaceae bacterium]|nr:polyprenyl synthetase family protein [Nocardioidaceae bacterium]